MKSEVILEKHSTKSKRSRTVPLSRQSRNYIKAYLEHRFEDSMDDWYNHPSGPLFRSRLSPDQVYTAGSATNRLRVLFRDAGIQGASSHSMRRTFANVLRQKGINLKVIQELLGHNSLATTERYFSVTDDEKRSAVHDLEF
jgi:integrase/recombinase XerD